MIALTFLVTALVLVNPFVPTSASTTPSRDPDNIPLVCDAGSTLIVPVSLPGAPSERFVLDTGASLSIIDRDVAERLRLTPSGRIPSRSGSAPLVTAQLTIGSITLPPHAIVSADFTSIRRVIGNVSGVLGADALHAIGAVTIDVERCSLRIGGTSVKREDRVALTWHEGRPVVISPDGGRLLLDSGATTLTLFEGRGAAASLRSGPTTLVRVDRIDGAGIGRMGRVSTLALGRLDLAGTPAVAVKSWYDATEREAPDGLLPLRLFSRVHINLSDGYAAFVAK
jgi:hypothetical protein